jgi:hypothetical protein
VSSKSSRLARALLASFARLSLIAADNQFEAGFFGAIFDMIGRDYRFLY